MRLDGLGAILGLFNLAQVLRVLTMMQTIEADLPPMVEPTFTTPGDAIAYAKRHTNRTRRGEDLTSYVGRSINSVAWADDAFRLDLDGGASLRIGVIDQAIEVVIEELLPEQLPGPSTIGDVALVRIGGTSAVWRRGQLISSLIGNEVYRIQTGAQHVFLYVRSIDLLFVNVLTDRSTGRPFLCWQPSD